MEITTIHVSSQGAALPVSTPRDRRAEEVAKLIELGWSIRDIEEMLDYRDYLRSRREKEGRK